MLCIGNVFALKLVIIWISLDLKRQINEVKSLNVNIWCQIPTYEKSQESWNQLSFDKYMLSNSINSSSAIPIAPPDAPWWTFDLAPCPISPHTEQTIFLFFDTTAGWLMCNIRANVSWILYLTECCLALEPVPLLNLETKILGTVHCR